MNIDSLLQPYLINAVAIIVLVSIAAGGVGSIMLWRRLAFLGDAIAHSSLLGVSVGMMMQINLTLSVILSSTVFASRL